MLFKGSDENRNMISYVSVDKASAKKATVKCFCKNMINNSSSTVACYPDKFIDYRNKAMLKKRLREFSIFLFLF